MKDEFYAHSHKEPGAAPRAGGTGTKNKLQKLRRRRVALSHRRLVRYLEKEGVKKD